MRHRVVTYLQFYIHICFYAFNVNNNRTVIGRRQKHGASRDFHATAWLFCMKGLLSQCFSLFTISLLKLCPY